MSVPESLAQVAIEALMTQPVIVSWRITEPEKAEVLARIGLAAAFAELPNCREMRAVATAVLRSLDLPGGPPRLALSSGEAVMYVFEAMADYVAKA